MSHKLNELMNIYNEAIYLRREIRRFRTLVSTAQEESDQLLKKNLEMGSIVEDCTAAMSDIEAFLDQE